jgi:2,3-bisphosphoglycerate-independent phosphoglycerate mutase
MSEDASSDDSININRSKSVVLLLIDGWGVAPLNEANVFSSARTPVFLNLIKEYPVAVLKSFGKNLNLNYLNLGLGQKLDDENIDPQSGITKVISKAGLTQLKISETERFAAITNFFNGLNENKENGEDWVIVSSESSVSNHKPVLALKRSLKEITKAINSEKYNFILVSWPLLDLVSASGDFEAVKKAVETIDIYLKKVLVLVRNKSGVLIVSATHGNVERMKNVLTELVDNEITDNPVPFLIVGEEFKGKTIGLTDTLDNDLSLLEPAGTLADISPTILNILEIEKPENMQGNSLI